MNPKIQIAVLVLGAVFAVVGIILSTRKHDRGKNTIKALGMEFQLTGSALVVFALGCVLILAALGLGGVDKSSVGGDSSDASRSTTTPVPVPTGIVSTGSCKVAGYVYNADTPASNDGLPNVKLAYIPNVPANATAVPMANTGPKGHFSFDCSNIRAEEFPVHLQMTYSWPGGSQIVLSDNQIPFAGNEEMNLYLSPRQITNWNKINKAILRIPTSELLRKGTPVSPITRPTIDSRTMVVRTNR